jgi:hypothetical protein
METFVGLDVHQRRWRNVMPTGKKAGTAASHTLTNPKATKEEKTAAASDLAQRPRPGSSGSSGSGKKK